MKIFGSVFSLFTGKRCRNPASQDRTRERAQVVRLESFFREEKSAGKCFCSVFFLKTHRMKNSFFIYHVGEWEEGERDFISSIRRRRRRLVEFREAGQTGRNGDRAEAATPTSTSKATTSPINFFLLSAKKRWNKKVSSLVLLAKHGRFYQEQSRKAMDNHRHNK